MKITILTYGSRGDVQPFLPLEDDSSNDLLHLKTAPCDWLLPRGKLVIHHGGAGTKPILVKNLSPGNLTRALVETESESICKNAETIGDRIRNGNGVSAVVKFIENYSNDIHR